MRLPRPTTTVSPCQVLHHTSLRRACSSHLQSVTFETCDNVELPVDPDIILDIIEETIGDNEDLDGIVTALEQISLSLSSNPSWQISFPFPDQLKISLDFNFVKKIPQALITNVISPKVILPFITMVKALGITYDDSLTGLRNFLRQNSQLVKNLMSRIGAFFIETLFNEIKKDVRNLVRAIIIDISKDDKGTIYLMLEKLIGIALKIIASYTEDQIITSDPSQILSIQKARQDLEAEGSQIK